MNRLALPRASLLLATLMLASGAAAAATPQVPVTPMTPDIVASYDAVRPSADFIKRVEMVPMRDGVKLYTVIFMKKGVKNAPILLSRTPYDAKHSTERVAGQTLTEVLPAMDAPFVDDGYIRVYQDIRGLHHSEGQWVMNRPLAGPLAGFSVGSLTASILGWAACQTPGRPDSA